MNSRIEKREQSEVVAESLVEQLLAHPEPLQLFDTFSLTEKFRRQDKITLAAEHTGKLVLEPGLVDEYRLRAAYLGAGFHMANWDEVMMTDSAHVGWQVSQDFSGFGYRATNYPLRVPRSTCMDDEISDELFITVAPTTEIHNGLYVTTEEDLRKLFIRDFINLQACRNLGYDLLYDGVEDEYFAEDSPQSALSSST